MTAYLWKTGFRAPVSAEVAGAEFERLERTGGLTPQRLVDASEAEDAPMHKAFEWDDEKAGNEWRKQQARMLINHIEIKHLPTEKKKPIRIRAFMQPSVSAPYESTVTIMKDEEKRSAVFAMGMKMLKDFKRRYADLKEFAKIIDAIDELQKGE